MPGNVSGGWARPLRRLSILVDIQDHATAQLMALKGASDKAAGSMKGAAGSAGALKAGLAATAVAAGASLIAMNRVTKVGAQLDETFAKVQATTNATAEEMEAIRDRTAEIGAEMPVTMGEVASAFEQFAYAGFEAEEAVEASQSAVELAVAGQISMDEAVGITTKTMNAFNMEAENSDTIVNALSTTYANSATEIQELGSAMSYASAQMSQMGFTATETTAALGVMADAGMEGTMAGTAMNQAFSQMITGGGNVERALSAVGMTMDDLTDKEGNMRPMVEIIQDFKDRLNEAGINGRGLSVWLEDIAGRRGARALGPLIEGAEDLEEKLRENALGATKDFLKGIEDVDQAKMEVLANVENVESAQKTLDRMSDERIIEWSHEFDTEIPEDPVEFVNWAREMLEQGEIAEDELEDRLQAMMNLTEDQAAEISKIIEDETLSDEDLEEDFEDAVTGSELTAAQMEEVGGKLEYLRGSFSAMVNEIYTGFKPALKAILDILIVFSDIINDNEWALRALGKAFFFVAGAASLWALKFAGQLALYYAGTAAVKGYVAALGSKIAVQTMSAGVAYSEAKLLWGVGQRYEALSKVIHGALIPSLKAKAAALMALNPWVLALTAALAILGAAVGAYATNFMGFADTVDHVRERLEPLVDVYHEFVEAFENKDISGMFEAWSKGVTMIADYITEQFVKLKDWILSGEFLDVGAEIVYSIADSVAKNGPAIIKALSSVVAVAFIAVIAGAGGIIAVAAILGYRLIDWIFSGIKDAGDRLAAGIAGAVIDAARSLVEFRNAFKQRGMALIDAIVEGIKSAPGDIYAAVKDKLGPIGHLLPESDADEGPLSSLTAAGENIPKTIAAGVENEGDTVRDKLEAIFGDTLGGAMADAGDFLGDDFAEALEGVIEYLDGTFENSEEVLEMFEDITDQLKRPFVRAVDGVERAIGALFSAVDRLRGAFESVVSKGKELIDMIPGLDKAAGVVGDALGWGAEKLGEGKEAVEGVLGLGDDVVDIEVDKPELLKRDFLEFGEQENIFEGLDSPSEDEFDKLTKHIAELTAEDNQLPTHLSEVNSELLDLRDSPQEYRDLKAYYHRLVSSIQQWVEENRRHWQTETLPKMLEEEGFLRPKESPQAFIVNDYLDLPEDEDILPEGEGSPEMEEDDDGEMQIKVEPAEEEEEDESNIQMEFEAEPVEEGHEQVFAEKAAERFVEEQAKLREESPLPESKTGDNVRSWIEDEVQRRLEEGDYPGDDLVHDVSKQAADRFGISEENARDALSKGIEAAKDVVPGGAGVPRHGGALGAAVDPQAYTEAGEKMSGAGDCIKRLCKSLERAGSGSAAGRAQPGQQFSLLGTPAPTGARGGSTAVSNDRVQYVDERKIVIEESPTIEINGGSVEQRRDWSKHIERAMEQARYHALDDFIDFLTLGGPGEMGDDPGTPSGEPDSGEPESPDSLPENWGEMDEEERQQWVDDLDNEEISDPGEAEDQLGSGDGTDGENGDGTDDENTDDTTE